MNHAQRTADTPDSEEVPQRRRLPRRKMVMPVAVERRRAHRRQAALGLDGLQRTVLADDWKHT